MHICQATNEDLKDIQQLNLDHFNYEIDLFDDTLNNQWTFSEKGEAYFKKMIGGVDSVIFVAKENDKTIGMLVAEILEHDSTRSDDLVIAELKQIYVADGHRNNGVGTVLSNKFWEWAKTKNANRARVIASAGNEEGINFYKKHGFKEFNTVLETVL